MAGRRRASRDDPETRKRRRELIGRRVLQLRLRHGWKQQDLVQKAGVTANTIRALETGSANTQWQNLVAIANALGTTADLLTAHTENDLELAWLHPELRDVTLEDLQIARLYHTASEPTQEYVRYLLAREQQSATPRPAALPTQIVARFAGLSARGQDVLENILRQLEQYEQQQQHTRKPGDALSSAS